MVLDFVLFFVCFCQFLVRAASGGDREGKTTIWKEKNEWKIDFSGEKPLTPLLDTINYPAHMKNLSTQVHKPVFLSSPLFQHGQV